MLRVLVFEEPFAITLRLEGELTKQTAPMLIQRWGDLRIVRMSRRMIVDLGDVLRVDQSGLGVLKWIFDSGAEIRNTAAGLRSAVEGAVCNDANARGGSDNRLRKMLRKLGCAPHANPALVCRLLCSLLPGSIRPCECRVD